MNGLFICVEGSVVRKFYSDEYEKSNWSTRQLERQVNTFLPQFIIRPS